MSYFYIEPEVSGSLGSETIINVNMHPPIVSRLNYQFDSWLGDDLIESFPCFIVTENLANQLLKNGISGISLNNVIITRSDDFIEFCGKQTLPKFFWLKVNGVAMKDDISLSDDFRLIVNQKVLDILRINNIDNADIEAVT